MPPKPNELVSAWRSGALLRPHGHAIGGNPREWPESLTAGPLERLVTSAVVLFVLKAVLDDGAKGPLLLTTLVVSTLALLVSGWTAWNLHRSQSPQRIIEARGLVIHDASGQPRVILGAPVPDPLSQGRTQGPRATALSGLILLGPDGSERGGYGTSDRGGEALLTLDDATGTTEVFKVVANPDRGASLMVKHQNNTGAMLTSWQGKPELMFVDDSGQSYYVRPGANAAP